MTERQRQRERRDSGKEPLPLSLMGSKNNKETGGENSWEKIASPISHFRILQNFCDCDIGIRYLVIAVIQTRENFPSYADNLGV